LKNKKAENPVPHICDFQKYGIKSNFNRGLNGARLVILKPSDEDG